MVIGLLRHSRVLKPAGRSRWMNSAEFREWAESYNSCTDICPKLPEGSDLKWEKKLSSDLYRAQITSARTGGHHELTGLLREVPVAPLFETKLRLPLWTWQFLARVAWLIGHPSQPETRKESLLRARRILNYVQSLRTRNCLLTTHGFFMKILQRVLKEEDWSGSRFLYPYHGRLHLFFHRPFAIL